MSAPILAAKLYMTAPRTGIVMRQRLTNRLNDGLAKGGKLTLVSAPVGFGRWHGHVMIRPLAERMSKIPQGSVVLGGRFGNSEHNLALYLCLFNQFMGTLRLGEWHPRFNDGFNLVLGEQSKQLRQIL